MSEIISLTELRKRRERRMALLSQSRVNLTLEKIGQRHTRHLGKITDEELEHLCSFWLVIDKASRNPFKLKSNFAREAALYVATCASLGFISNQIEHNEFINVWGATPAGEDFLEELNEILDLIYRWKDPNPTN